MDQRALDTLAWLDSHDAEIDAHQGAACAEVELLRALVEGEPHAPGVFGRAYQRHLDHAALPSTARADARALCHYIMFAGDFCPDSITLAASYAAWIDEALLEHVNDADTTAEILIAAVILGLTSPAITAARTAFDVAWAALPRVDFDTDYHAVLVGGILYAIAP